MTPQRLVDTLLRIGREGDRFGLRRGGLSLKALRAQPHGVVTAESIPTGVLPGRLRHEDRKVHLDHPALNGEIARLRTVNGDDPAFPLRLIGLRELRSHNSWMHNAPILMRGGREQPLRIHPLDAERYGLEDGGTARLASKSGEVEVPVRVTDEVRTGVVALPHGWGHRGGWRVANAAGGVNVNVLASADAGDLEPLAGMAFLNGIPVRVEPVAPARAAARDGGRAGPGGDLARRQEAPAIRPAHDAVPSHVWGLRSQHQPSFGRPSLTQNAGTRWSARREPAIEKPQSGWIAAGCWRSSATPSSIVSGERPAARMSLRASSGRTFRDPAPRSTSTATYAAAAGTLDGRDRLEGLEVVEREMPQHQGPAVAGDARGRRRERDEGARGGEHRSLPIRLDPGRRERRPGAPPGHRSRRATPGHRPGARTAGRAPRS